MLYLLLFMAGCSVLSVSGKLGVENEMSKVSAGKINSGRNY